MNKTAAGATAAVIVSAVVVTGILAASKGVEVTYDAIKRDLADRKAKRDATKIMFHLADTMTI